MTTNSRTESDLRPAKTERAGEMPVPSAPQVRSAWWPAIWRLLGVAAIVGIAAELASAGRKHWWPSVLAAGMLSLALCGFTLSRAGGVPQEGTRVIAYDVSASVGMEALQQLSISQSGVLGTERNPVRFLPFAARPGQISALPPGPTADFGLSVPGQGSADLRDETDIAAALQRAASSERLAEILLLSDGNQTRGDSIRTAQAVGVPVVVIPLNPLNDSEFWIESLTVPDTTRESEPFTATVVVNGNGSSEGTLRLISGEGLITSQTVAVEGRAVFELPCVLGPKWSRLEVALSGFDDLHSSNNSASCLLRAESQPQILVIDDNPNSMAPFRIALGEQGIRVSSVPAEEVPQRAHDFTPYDAVVLADVEAQALSADQQAAIYTFVDSLGGGLIVLGGERSFGLGGYAGSPLSDLFPLTCDFERTDQMPTLAMVLAIDRSSSMSDLGLQFAKEAAVAAIDTLGPEDQLGLVTFDVDARWISNISPRDTAMKAIPDFAALGADGGTAILPALQTIHQALTRSEAQLKHVVVLTDGHSDFGKLDEQVASMAADGITVSTIAVGAGSNQSQLSQLATTGLGRSFYCSDPLAIPQIVVQDTVLATESAIDENTFRPMWIELSSVFRGMKVTNAPPLYGYVRSRLKPFAELLMTTDDGEPLLARHRAGLGRAVAFTSDAKGRWAKDWLGWAEFGAFWSRIARAVMKDDKNEYCELELDRTHDRITATCELVDRLYAYRNDARLSATFVRGDGTREQHRMELVGPGTYEASIGVTADSVYVSVAEVSAPSKHLAHTALTSRINKEMHAVDSRQEVLREIASVSGGRFLASLDQLTETVIERHHKRYELAPWLCLLSLIIFVGGVVRRES